MKSRFSFLLPFLFGITLVYGQDLTRQDADSMINALKKSKPDINRIDLLLSLAQFHIFKAGERQVDFDSADVFIKEAAALNATVQSNDAAGYLLLTESYMVKEKGRRDDAKKMAEKAVTILETGRNKSYLGKAYYELSAYCNWREFDEELRKMIGLVEKAVAAFRQDGNLERKAFSLTMLGDLNSILGNNQQAIAALKSALEAYDSIHYTKLQGVYALLGRVYIVQSDHRQALHYQLLALKSAEAEKDSGMLYAIYNNLGNIYNSLKQHELSIRYYKTALLIARKYDDAWNIVPLITSIAQGYTSLGQSKKAIEFLGSNPKKYLDPPHHELKILIDIAYLTAYINGKEFDKAKSCCELLLNLTNGNHVSNETKSTVYRTAARYFIKVKNYKAARTQLVKHDKIVSDLGPFRVAMGYEIWYTLESAQGNYRDAFYHFAQRTKINDSIFNATKARQLQQLEIEYETAKKQDSIKLKNRDISLLTQKNNLQQANLQKASIVKNVTIAGIVLAFIIIGLLYKQYRHKQKSNTVITQKNDQLQHLLTEKEWLLKEIHHRVKNNLQIVMSLLNSQSAYIDNEPALTAIHDSQHRVHAMSLIHQKLYGTENVSSIDMPSYIRELASYLRDSFDTGQRLRFEFSLAPLELDVSQAVPLGLILNEAITNSIKYAFPDKRDGLITISLSGTSANHYLLSITDNGIGMPSHVNNKRPGSLGMSLMAGLAEDLEGNFTIENDDGTKIKISFVYERSVKRAGVLATSFTTWENQG